MLSVRRNLVLQRLAGRIRDDTSLRAALADTGRGDASFESQLADFEDEFGGTSFASHRCFADRAQLVRFVLTLAAAPAGEAADEKDVDSRSESFLGAVDRDKVDLARQLLDLGRASHRLRDDDNLHLARLESLVHAAVEEGRRRLRSQGRDGTVPVDLEGVARALRHPNLVAEPRPEEVPMAVEKGFHASPRQLVGQPAGPGVATGPARLIEAVEDLFLFQPGEILVCDAIDPNMTFVVPLATILVETGDRLTVDGYLGIVTVSRGSEP